MMKYTLYLLIALACGTAACEAPQAPAGSDSPIIRIDSLLQSHMAQLVKKGAVQKTVEVGAETSETQSLSFTAKEWKKELDFFLNANIHRKSWVDDIAIDSTFEQEHLHITYRATDDRIPVESCSILQTIAGELIHLQIRIRRATALSSLERDLIYAFPDSIHIENRESFVFLSPHELTIHYEWK